MKELLKQLQQGSIEARDELISLHLPLAIFLGKKYYNKIKNDELISVAQEELVFKLEQVRVGEKILREDSNIGAWLNSQITYKLKRFIRDEIKNQKKFNAIKPEIIRRYKIKSEKNLNAAIESLLFWDILNSNKLNSRDLSIIKLRKEGFNDYEISEILKIKRQRVTIIKSMKIKNEVEKILGDEDEHLD